MPLTEVNGVNNSCVALCYADEFMKLLSTDEGVIRKSLFEDNVRDYQGLNSVNEEISKTILNEPEKFALLNNGITIVCDEYIQNNRRLILKNPQIVNGCQTSHVLFFASKESNNLKLAPLHIKIISTSNLGITNQIVRGTNRQSIVYDEAFEATKLFHKELEDFFNAINHDYGKVYYERRSKQFQHNPKIKPTDKVNLKTLTQYSIAVLFNKPHMSHRHEAKIIEEFSDKIFINNQSKLPYYAVSLLFVNAEKLFRTSELKDNKVHTYRPHILMVLREICCGRQPNLLKEKKVDTYFKEFLETICDQTKLLNALQKAILVFENATDHWVNDLNKSSDGRKDIEEFTKILLEFCKDNSLHKSDDSEPEDDLLYGEVVKVIKDRKGFECGFIHRKSGDLFFHSQSNINLEFKELVGKLVAYEIEKNQKTGKDQAVNVKLVTSQ